MFFLNIAPDKSSDSDEFVNGMHNGMNKYFVDLLGKDGVPVVSSYDAFPSGHLAVCMTTFTVISENYPEYKMIWTYIITTTTICLIT